MKLKDICVIGAVSCLPSATITEAARAMREQHVGDLIVVDDADEDREPIGMITDRDIVIEVVARRRDPDKVTVGEVMAKNVVIASAAEDAEDALERMRKQGVRRVPVVNDEGFVIGIITLDDLLRSHAEAGAALAQVVANAQRRETRTRS